MQKRSAKGRRLFFGIRRGGIVNQGRFVVTYRIQGGRDFVRQQAEAICLEQTVELPDQLTPDGFIREEILGRIEAIEEAGPGRFDVRISYADACAAGELTQFLNVVFGNTSLKPGIRVQGIALSPGILGLFPGPRFGIKGVRKRVGQPNKPLLCTALKPMGYSPREIAKLAHGFAMGGVDIIKDDHGLSDQPFCRFEERVRACVAAVAEANARSGHGSLYAPNITAPFPRLLERARFAVEQGAGALLIAPGLTGFDAMRHLAADPSIHLPILAHPALLGSAVTGMGNGFSHGVLFGLLQRLAGADVSIFPNYGGRFGFSRPECAEIAAACTGPLGELAPIFPSPGGGMTLDRVPDMLDLYGEDVLFLIGGGLYGHSPDLAANVRYFLGMVGR